MLTLTQLVSAQLGLQIHVFCVFVLLKIFLSGGGKSDEFGLS